MTAREAIKKYGLFAYLRGIAAWRRHITEEGPGQAAAEAEKILDRAQITQGQLDRELLQEVTRAIRRRQPGADIHPYQED